MILILIVCLTYCCKRSDVSPSECDGTNINEIAFHDKNKMFDKVVIEDQYTPCNDFYDDFFNVTDSFADCEEPFEDPGVVSDNDIDDICEYKSECSCEYYPVMQKDIQCQGMYDLFPYTEYDAFIFEVNNMLDSANEEDFYFQSSSYKHVVQSFHNEQEFENEASFYMHYGSKNEDLVLLTVEFQDVDLIGETDRRSIFNLPHTCLDENQVFDKGKGCDKVWWPCTIVCA